MGLKINEDTAVLEKDRADFQTVYNLFFHGNQNIIYVCDRNRKLEGIITIKVFLDHLKASRDDYIKREFAFVFFAQNAEEMLREAARLMEQFHIETAIPVVDAQRRLCFEIKAEHISVNMKTVVENKEMFSKYTKSVYLRKETEILKKVLRQQKIMVIGTMEQLEESFGAVFDDKCNLCFMDDHLENPYDFFGRQENLVLDLCVHNHEGRKDIYWNCHNGYSAEMFWNLLLTVVKREECSRFFKVTEENKRLLEEVIKSYPVCFLVTPLLKKAMIKYLRENDHMFSYEKGVLKSDTCKFILSANGTNPSKKDLMLMNIDILAVVDSCIEYAKIYEHCKNKGNVLNFVCGRDLEISSSEAERIGDQEAILTYIEEMKSEKTKNWMFDRKEKPCTYMADLYQFHFSNQRRFENDLILFEDCNSQFVNIENGIRKTCGQPEQFAATIYFLGFCTIYGRLSEDKDTIPSIVQARINQSGKKYRVVNLGTLVPVDAFRLLDKLEIKSNDLFVIFYSIFPESMKKQIPVTDISGKLNSLRIKKYENKEIYLDMMLHVSDYGNKLYGEVLYEEIKKYLSEEKELYKNNIYTIFRKDYQDLETLYNFETYLAHLRDLKEKVPSDKKQIGSVVMNCNPFTLGHLYLIEFALKQVDYLYLFVVEEDRSYFSFPDRLKMVQKGTRELEGVCVLGSGKGCASSITMPQYFGNKYVESRQREKVSLGLDLRVFSQYIAPELNIRYRFTGEEPLDQITRQYNQTMQKLLPQFGIGVTTIARKNTQDGEVISASKVREAFQTRHLQCVAHMIPLSTQEYLCSIRDNYL